MQDADVMKFTSCSASIRKLCILAELTIMSSYTKKTQQSSLQNKYVLSVMLIKKTKPYDELNNQ